MVSIIEKRTVERGLPFSAVLFELENAVLALLYEGEKPRLGTVAMALPFGGASSIMLGDRYITIARMIAERVSSDYGKMAIASVFVKTLDETEAGGILARLVKKLLEAGRKG